MPRAPKSPAAPRGHSWEKRIENALMLGEFVSWREISEFREELTRLLEELVSFAEKHPKAAVPIYEVFIAGCLEKGDEVDDSGNDLGSFLDELACAWSQACEAAGMKGDEYVRKLAHWIDADGIGFFSDLESTVLPALGREFREALEGELKGRLERLSKEVPGNPGQERSKIAFDRRRAIETLKKLYAETKNTTALIAFCEQHGVDQKDCLDLATVFFGRKQFDRALEWAEKGLNLKEDRYSKEYELKELRRKILKSAGRGSDAVADAWAEFEKHPSIYSFESVLESATPREHADLKAKALAIFDQSELREAAVALHKLKELDRLDSRLARAKDEALQSIFYGEAIPIAEALSKKHPKTAARVYIAQAFEILSEKRAKAYHHAHDYLQSAKTLLEKCGEAATWSALVEGIRREHRLKSSFMPGFEKIAAGEGPPREPTFQERIAKRLDQASLTD